MRALIPGRDIQLKPVPPLHLAGIYLFCGGHFPFSKPNGPRQVRDHGFSRIKLENGEKIAGNLVFKITVDQPGLKIFALHDVPAKRLQFIIGIAGAASMRVSRFELYSISGAFAWVYGLIWAGHLFGNIPLIRNHLTTILLCGIASALVPTIILATIKFFKRRFSQNTTLQ